MVDEVVQFIGCIIPNEKNIINVSFVILWLDVVVKYMIVLKIGHE